MTRDDMLAELRIVLDDTASPYGWADATLTSYLSEGQDKFCELTGYFIDTTDYSITLETDVAVYDIPDRIIQVIAIWDGVRKLEHVKTGKLGNDLSSSATPYEWQTDRDTGVVKVFPTPTSDDNGDEYILQVWRYSVYDLAGDGAIEGTAALPEIPSRFQRACIEWAAHKAFNHHDLDVRDEVKAKQHLDFFRMYVTDGTVMMRRYHNIEARVGSNPHYRT